MVDKFLTMGDFKNALAELGVPDAFIKPGPFPMSLSIRVPNDKHDSVVDFFKNRTDDFALGWVVRFIGENYEQSVMLDSFGYCKKNDVS